MAVSNLGRVRAHGCAHVCVDVAQYELGLQEQSDNENEQASDTEEEYKNVGGGERKDSSASPTTHRQLVDSHDTWSSVSTTPQHHSKESKHSTLVTEEEINVDATRKQENAGSSHYIDSMSRIQREGSKSRSNFSRASTPVLSAQTSEADLKPYDDSAPPTPPLPPVGTTPDLDKISSNLRSASFSFRPRHYAITNQLRTGSFTRRLEFPSPTFPNSPPEETSALPTVSKSIERCATPIAGFRALVENPSVPADDTDELAQAVDRVTGRKTKKQKPLGERTPFYTS